MRHTYCVSQRPETQLQCFTEKDEERATIKAASSVFSLNDSQSPVVFLETIPVHQASDAQISCDILVVHQDGTIRRIAGDLSRQKWSIKISDSPNGPSSDLNVRAAHSMSVEQARKSLLKNRPDLQTGRDGEGSDFLVLIAKRTLVSGERTQDMIYGLCSLAEQRLPNGFGNNGGHRMTPLVLQTLPGTEIWGHNEAAQYNFNLLNGALSVAFSHGLITYDLSTYTPEIVSKLSVDSADTSYPLRLTPSLAVGSTPSAVTVYDTKYQSIQSTVNMGQIGSRRKRKRVGSTHRTPVRFVTYFAKIKRLVACRGHALIAFDIANIDPQSNHVASSGDRMLIDAIGRGMPSELPQRMETSEASSLNFGAFAISNHDTNESWASQQQRLEELAKKGDITAFNELMTKELCKCSDLTQFIDHGALQLPYPSPYVDLFKANYLISRIFEPFPDIEVGMGESPELGHNLKIVLPTSRLIHWLIVAGKCTDRSVERALQRTKLSQAFAVRPGAVALALIRDQPSYEMIIDYLKQSPSLPVSEILQALKLLLKDVVSEATKSLPPTLLQEGEVNLAKSLPEHATPTDQENGVGSVETLALSLKMPPGDGTAPSPSSIAMLTALERFGSHSSYQITAELRSLLGQSEILSIIQILRQQLFYSGHTSYLPTPPNSARSSPKLGNTHAEGASLALDTILRLLSSCLHAIGPVGFLAQSEHDDFLEKLIPDLKSEVSFAFEGMQETSHLQGLLREVIRYGDSVQSTKGGHATNSTSQQADFEGQQKPGTVVTLYTEAKLDQGDVEERGGLLPLSLRANNTISETKVRKGGGQVSRRSRRDILKLQDRNVGQYSFERLVL